MLGIAQLGPLPVMLPAIAWLYWTDQAGVGNGAAGARDSHRALDNVLRPILIRRGVQLPMLLIIAGVIGGLIGFGVMGLFVGPVILAATYTLAKSWVAEGPQPGDADRGSAMKPSINWLLVFIPITLVLEHPGGCRAPVIFFCAALAIMPIAALIVRSTGQLATYTGDAVGGLLNATFGNAPELIIALVALKRRPAGNGARLDHRRDSGESAAGARHRLPARRRPPREPDLQHQDASRAYSTMMLLAAMSLAVPSAFSRYFAPDETIRQEALLNVWIAGGAAGDLCAVPVVFAQDSSGHIRQCRRTGRTRPSPRGCALEPAARARQPGRGFAARGLDERILVGAADGTGKALGMSSVFIGIVFLAVVGGAAESGSAIAMGAKNKVDLSHRHRHGQLDPDRAVHRARAGVRQLFHRARATGVVLRPCRGRLAVHRRDHRRLVCGDGQANWFKGAQLITVYLIFALMFYFMPGAA